MEIVKEFGIDIKLLVAQVINFVVIFFILKRFFYKPILEILQKRQKTIEEGLAKAEEGRLLLEKASEKERQILKTAQVQAKKLIEDAREQAQDFLKQAEVRTAKQTETMMKTAREQIQNETKLAEQKLMKQVSQLAVHFLEKSLKDLFDQKTQEEIMTRAIKKIKNHPN